tara:strand:- start:621 stop:1259 length:639 start_codon:yes stop_codon:yes gene_type:complete
MTVYEPKDGYYGQFSTDVLIELFFKNKQHGVCVEVGVANGIRGSNTLYFEKKGWNTLCVEPNPEYFQQAKKIRQRVLNYACGATTSTEEFSIFDIGDKNIMSSLSSLHPDERLIKSHKHLINDVKKIQVKVRTLNALLELANMPKNIDFISIDTEGTELDVLRGLDLNYWNVGLLVVENNFEDPEISEHLSDYGFVRDSRWKINDFYTKGWS